MTYPTTLAPWRPASLGCLLALVCVALPACGAAPPPTERPTHASPVPVRAYLLHLTHYDPEWNDKRWRDQPVDETLALEVVRAMADAHMNTLILDVEDGVVFASHPELRRPHSLPMESLRRIVRAAHAKGIDVVPKVNFSRGVTFDHNAWMSPYDKLDDTDAYWRVAFDVIDELIRETKPRQYFHIGMDEDTARSPEAYVRASTVLDAHIRGRGLRAVMWNDSAQVFDKASRWRSVEQRLPRTLIQVLWDYHDLQFEGIAHLRRLGFDVWAAPGVDHLDQVRQWRADVLHLGGTGMVLTQWLPCTTPNRGAMLGAIRVMGPLYE